jgi:signal transduction histidine kinase/ActR/RegA family two-component response regulator
MSSVVCTLALDDEQDLVHARQRARLIASLVGFEPTDQTRFSTAVSEIARNACQYGGGGEVVFALDLEGATQALAATVRDHGPGIPDLAAVLEGRHRSRTGMGVGIAGTRRIMDRFTIESAPGGTVVSFARDLPSSAPRVTAASVRHMGNVLARTPAENPLEEVRLQNHELMRALDELRERQAQLAVLHAELEDTNRGVLALYAELDEKAKELARVNEQEARFLSHASHEFRTPLSSIIALSRILLDRVDGELTDEQVTQVTFIRDAAANLTALVDDLLVLAKMEAGKTTVHARSFTVAELFSTLRGMLKPVLPDDTVSLFFEEVGADMPDLYTDDGKVSQILRNLLTNAFKFTHAGEIRVSATLGADHETVALQVADTGIGIAPEDQQLIFDEYAQVHRAQTRATKGTGLGLPICRRLAGLLGGRIELKSRPGEGSTFTAVIPVHYAAPAAAGGETPDAPVPARPEPAGGHADAATSATTTILIVDDEAAARYVLKSHLDDRPYRIVEATDGGQALRLAAGEHPAAIFLDLMMPEVDGFEALRALAGDDATRDIPVIVVTGRVLGEAERRELEEHAVAILSKQAPTRAEAHAAVQRALSRALAAPRTEGRRRE